MRKRKFSSNETVNDVFIVENICKKKIRTNKEPLYFIKWKDWDDKYNTWEPQSNILDKSLIDIFEDEQKGKLKGKKDLLKPQEWSTAKESEVVEKAAEESKCAMEQVVEKNNDKPDKEDKLDSKLCADTETRPKICLKIQKHRIYAPNTDLTKKPQDNNSFDQEIEKSRKYHTIDDEWIFFNNLSPNGFSSDECLNKSLNDNPTRNNKTSRKSPDNCWTKHSLSYGDKIFKSADFPIRKPRKLLSINEYSAKMKKHHKKSKPDKQRIEDKPHSHIKQQKNHLEGHIENKKEEKLDSKSSRKPFERPLILVENQIESWTEKSAEKEVITESVKDEELKQVVEKFKYHANTIVTDVTIRNLSVTIREMPYEDFIENDTSRYLMIRVPIHSDWLMRYRGDSNKNCEEDNDSDIEEVHKEIGENKSDIKLISDKNQKLLDRLTESMLPPGLRPPSRPRSVDSYKTAIDKNYSGGGARNPFSATVSPKKISAECQVQDNIESFVHHKSPLHVVIDDCEEVDVVGGIESDHSFVGSLQSETVTVSAQIRQSLPINTSPVTSIIQSLLQSYSYNHSMMMPPLQAAPWMNSQTPTNQLYQISRQNNNNVQLLPSNSNLQSNSMEPGILKYTENACLLYHQPTGAILSDIYLNTSQDMPIDLSFK